MIKSFFAALSFISRLPVPARLSQGLEIEQYQRSIVTFPLVGLLLGAISGAVRAPHIINQSKCIKCGACMDNCRFGAISKH